MDRRDRYRLRQIGNLKEELARVDVLIYRANREFCHEKLMDATRNAWRGYDGIVARHALKTVPLLDYRKQLEEHIESWERKLHHYLRPYRPQEPAFDPYMNMREYFE